MSTTTRMRISHEKANLLSILTDEQVAAMLSALKNDKAPITAIVPEAVEQQEVYPAPFLGGDPRNVLVIPDLHAPYIRDGFLEWLLEQQKKYNCGRIIAIGDVCDGASWNFHEKNPDMQSVGDELESARRQLNKVFSMFPGTDEYPVFTCLGNHDLLVARKMKSAGLSAKFMKPFGEIFGAPETWKFGYQIEIDGVVYMHGGAGGKADRMAKESRKSTVQGHFHAESYVQHFVSEYSAIFAMQVGSGQDDKACAFDYGKPFPRKSVIGCGVVLDSGKTPISIIMPL